MKNILTIAKWEVNRFRSKFGGKSKFIILPVLVLAALLSYTIYHQDFTICKGLYTIGVAPNGPIITDTRFNVVTVDRKTGESLVNKKKLDLFVTDTEVVVRPDDRSQYAAGALQKYLEKQELSRIAGEYQVNQAFPLRISISYLGTPVEAADSIAEAATSPSPDEPPAKLTLPSFSNPVSGSDSPAIAPAPAVENPAAPIQSSAASSPAQLPVPVSESPTDSAVQEQLANLENTRMMPEFKAEFVSEDDVIIPSLMSPPMPLAQVIIAFLYIIPIFFVSVFFTSSFTEEKVNRKLVILLSSPVSKLEIMLGKMLPYFIYSILVIVAVTIFLKGNLLTALSIFLPVMLFIFSIYLMVALTYRTFKDQTFFSVLALSIITVYMVVPAMFTGVSDLSFVSPLTLAVTMYRGETFGINEYLIATIPLYLTFFLVMYMGQRVFNEEYLMGFKPLHTKAAEALYLTINKNHLNFSIFTLSLLLIPIVFAIQLLCIVIVSNLPSAMVLWLVMLIAIVIEEVAKSMGLLVLLKHKIISRKRDLLTLSALSALGFWTGEKLLLLLAMRMSDESKLISAILGSGTSIGWLWFAPLVLHAATTFIVVLLASRGRKLSYFQGLLAASIIHAVYNFSVLIISGALW